MFKNVTMIFFTSLFFLASNVSAIEITVKTGDSPTSDAIQCSHVKSDQNCNQAFIGSSCQHDGNQGTCMAKSMSNSQGVCICSGGDAPVNFSCSDSNVFGKFAKGGGCNTFGCYPPGGSCNTFGCTKSGECNVFDCPQKIKSFKCDD